MAGVIFWMSSNTGETVNSGLGIVSAIKGALATVAAAITGDANVDVSPIGHFAEYFILGLLLANALRFHVDMKWIVLGAVCIAGLYGASDEFHQYFVPERSCDPADWAVDTVAAFVGALVYWVIAKRS